MAGPQMLVTVDEAVAWLRGRVRGALRTDSRAVQRGDGFIAWPGYAHDGRQFVADALARGAAACLVERAGVEPFAFADPNVAAFEGLKAATGPLADAWFEHPSRRLQVVAATGTNGKSSTAWWTAQALTCLDQRCGVIGTLGVGTPPLPDDPQGRIEFTGLTTPDPVRLQAALREFVDSGFYACAIEASSIGLAEHRLAGTQVAVAQFTNFTRDHLDYHGSMQAYWEAKRALFAWPGLKAAVINIDDEQGERLAAELASRHAHIDVWTTSTEKPARLAARALGYQDGGLAFQLAEGDATVPVKSGLIGQYNASNLLAVLGALRALGLPLARAAEVVPLLTPVPGRMQRVQAELVVDELPEVVVDYAHTPDALDKALAALRPLAAARGGRLWCVFGCGGNRDATKRPLMGAIAQRLADRVVVTSDNPRDENPALIVEQIVAGTAAGGPAQLHTLVDRHEAIAFALAQAGAQDVVLLAGKGHEDYQEVAGEKRPFSDVAEAQAALARRQGTLA
jgi:UDP-N-acetylmuramoyl-L-alanyl-D-glutamate--2,6-diaminopimelate ligase